MHTFYSRKIMDEKDPANIPLLTYAWVIIFSTLGGVSSFMQKLKTGHARVFNVVEFVGEVCTSAFVGVITFLLCESAEITHIKAAALVAISGHMGSKTMRLFEQLLTDYFPNKQK